MLYIFITALLPKSSFLSGFMQSKQKNIYIYIIYCPFKLLVSEATITVHVHFLLYNFFGLYLLYSEEEKNASTCIT